MWFLCGRWAVVAQHDAEGSGVIVGQRAAAAFIKEGQQEGEKQQSEEEEPQKKSQPQFKAEMVTVSSPHLMFSSLHWKLHQIHAGYQLFPFSSIIWVQVILWRSYMSRFL